MATEKKPPITCHVLDTSVGRPAADIPVTLTLHNATASESGNGEVKFEGRTNGDVSFPVTRITTKSMHTTDNFLTGQSYLLDARYAFLIGNPRRDIPAARSRSKV
jgi:5-hydroxyisourate hydrolase